MKIAHYGVGRRYPDAARMRRIQEVWGWIVAFDAFDHCDANPLERLLRSGEAIPTELQPALADIVAGHRKPNKKAGVKLKVPAGERLEIAAAIATILGLIDSLKSSHQTDSGQQRLIIEVVAEKERREPLDMLRELEAEVRQTIADSANELGVSVGTIENLLEDLREKLESFPDV